MPENFSPRKMQAVILGCDYAKGPDRSSYYCRECGPSSTPCEHLDSYVKAQRREAMNRHKREAVE